MFLLSVLYQGCTELHTRHGRAQSSVVFVLALRCSLGKAEMGTFCPLRSSQQETFPQVPPAETTTCDVPSRSFWELVPLAGVVEGC